LPPVSTIAGANLLPVSTTQGQTMGTISGWRYLKVNLKAKIFIYMLTLLSKGVPTKLSKFFRLKIFFLCHRCQRHRWSTLSCEYLRKFSKKFETALMVYSRAWGKLIHEKNQKSKISWHCPFIGIVIAVSVQRKNWFGMELQTNRLDPHTCFS
jgi:hypothetical protein